MEKRLQKKIIIQAKKRFHLEKFEIAGRPVDDDRRMAQEQNQENG